MSTQVVNLLGYALKAHTGRFTTYDRTVIFNLSRYAIIMFQQWHI